MKLLITICMLLSVALFGFGQEKNILFIGNSFTHYNSMPEYFDSICVHEHKEVNVGMFAKSNHTLKMHSERDDLFQAIESKKWDIVIVQGFSREFAQADSVILKESIPYFDKIYSSIMDNNPTTQVFLYMTWGYKYGYKQQEWNNNQQKMLTSIRHGYQFLSDKYNLPIIPVGDVWYNVYNKKNINLFQKDNHHPNQYGSILVASAMYVGLFNQSLHAYDFQGMKARKLRKIRKSTNTFFKKFSTYYGLERMKKSNSYMTNTSQNLSYYTPEVDVLVYRYMSNSGKLNTFTKDYSKLVTANKNNNRSTPDGIHTVFIAPTRREGYLTNKK